MRRVGFLANLQRRCFKCTWQLQVDTWYSSWCVWVHLDVVHALCSHAGVHLLVAIQLISDSPVDIDVKEWKLFEENFQSTSIMDIDMKDWKLLHGIQFTIQCDKVFISPEEASSIFSHGFDDVPLPPHHSLKPVLEIMTNVQNMIEASPK